MSASPITLGFPPGLPPALAEELEIIESRHALGLDAPAVVVLTYDGAAGPTTVVWTPRSEDRADALRWFRAARGGR